MRRRWHWVLSPLLLFFSAALWAVEAGYRNFLGMEFVTIEVGEPYFMGSCRGSYVDHALALAAGIKTAPPCLSGAEEDEDATDNELPQHEVRLSEPFQMGVFEVTLGQFSRYLEALGSGVRTTEFQQANQHGSRAAVSGVSWNAAQRFIQWLNINKPIEDQGHYRLPSEAEWEYVARAGSVARFGFSESSDELIQYAWYDKNAYDLGQHYAHEVGKKQPNVWGVYDMLGNVWEWTADCWHINYRGAPKDGRPWLENCEGDEHPFRGGAWPFYARNERVAFRYYSSAAYHNELGLRVVRALPVAVRTAKNSTHSPPPTSPHRR
ncbi:MAG: formylglycine-generating enzyme family protein [Gammaproteobacteria bacterium]|nr:formylglycine-generating enzyme family protein [Gammaproteobacteria bacterium]